VRVKNKRNVGNRTTETNMLGKQDQGEDRGQQEVCTRGGGGERLEEALEGRRVSDVDSKMQEKRGVHRIDFLYCMYCTLLM